jgi:uncharacterized protein with PIN domain
VRNVDPKHKAEPYLPSFLADAMLGDIARKLRILGYDTTYIKDTSDSCVLQAALKEKRILLTRDKELFKRVVKRGIQGILLEKQDETDNIAYALTKNKIYCVSFDARTARCSLCNGILEPRSSTKVKRRLPRNVVTTYNKFSQCSNCGKAYWEGSHISRLHMLAQKINNKIRKSSYESTADFIRDHDNKRLKSQQNKSNTILNEQKSRVGENSQQGFDTAAGRIYSSD